MAECYHAKTCFGFWFMVGGVPIINQGIRVGLGGAARSTSSTSRRKSRKIRMFSGEQYSYCHPLIIADGTCL